MSLLQAAVMKEEVVTFGGGDSGNEHNFVKAQFVSGFINDDEKNTTAMGESNVFHLGADDSLDDDEVGATDAGVSSKKAAANKRWMQPEASSSSNPSSRVGSDFQADIPAFVPGDAYSP